MLSVVKHKTKSTLNEMKVLAALSRWHKSEQDINTFYSNFQAEMKAIKASNHQPVHHSYDLVLYTNKVELYHLDSKGEYDRNVATIINWKPDTTN